MILSNVEVQSITIGTALQAQYKGVAYVCPMPMCSKIISIQMDPIALKSDTIAGVQAALRH